MVSFMPSSVYGMIQHKKKAINPNGAKKDNEFF